MVVVVDEVSGGWWRKVRVVGAKAVVADAVNNKLIINLIFTVSLVRVSS